MTTGSVSLAFRVSPEKAEQLDRLVAATDRPRSWLLEQALDAYLETHAWQIEHIQQGLKEIRAGQGVSHEAVAAWLDGWGTPAEGEAPTTRRRRR